jgi:nucleotide-binding universal stress UspA family protein
MNRSTETDEPRQITPPTDITGDLHWWTLREIVVPTDLTLENRKAVTYAMTLARSCNAHVTLLHVYQEPYSLEYLRGPGLSRARDLQRQSAQNALEVLGKQAKEEYANCSTEFREGTLCQEIANLAKDLDADLMIVGSRANKWFRRCAYGSDAEAIVRVSPCPVLIVN